MKYLFFIILFLSFSLKAESLRPKQFWFMAMPPNSKVSASYGVIKNSSNKTIELTRAESSIAKVVEIHTHKKVDGVMKMRKVESLSVPAKGKLELRPGGDHIMFFGLKKTPKVGESVNLNLFFKDGSKISVQSVVRKKPFKASSKGHHHH